MTYDNEEEIEQIKTKIKYFYDEKKVVHIKLKNKRFLNGVIISIHPKFFVIKEFIFNELVIFYNRIKEDEEAITEYQKKEVLNDEKEKKI